MKPITIGEFLERYGIDPAVQHANPKWAPLDEPYKRIEIYKDVTVGITLRKCNYLGQVDYNTETGEVVYMSISLPETKKGV